MYSFVDLSYIVYCFFFVLSAAECSTYYKVVKRL